MKRDKIIYWISTVIIAGMFAFSSFLYLTKNQKLVDGFKQIGFPEFFIPLLGVAKLLAAIAFVIPIWNRAKEWAYAGTSFVLIGAAWVHIVTNTPFIAPIVFLAITMVSYWFGLRLYSNSAK